MGCGCKDNKPKPVAVTKPTAKINIIKPNVTKK